MKCATSGCSADAAVGYLGNCATHNPYLGMNPVFEFKSLRPLEGEMPKQKDPANKLSIEEAIRIAVRQLNLYACNIVDKTMRQEFIDEGIRLLRASIVRELQAKEPNAYNIFKGREIDYLFQELQKKLLEHGEFAGLVTFCQVMSYRPINNLLKHRHNLQWQKPDMAAVYVPPISMRGRR